jgi:hypothetical protein
VDGEPQAPEALGEGEQAVTGRPRAALAILLALVIPACAYMPVRTGTRPRIEFVETALEVGETRRGQVLEILGPPDGAGRASLPMHPEPRAVWNYTEQDASWERISYRFLLLFFDDEVLSGYLWYTIEDVSFSNSAPQWLRAGMESP